MGKEELAKRIKDRVVMIGIALKHIESIIKYSQNNKEFEVSNVCYFDDWCYMATNSLNEVCILNDKLASALVPKEMYEENLDDFINQLKQKQEM